MWIKISCRYILGWMTKKVAIFWVKLVKISFSHILDWVNKIISIHILGIHLKCFLYQDTERGESEKQKATWGLQPFLPSCLERDWSSLSRKSRDSSSIPWKKLLLFFYRSSRKVSCQPWELYEQGQATKSNVLLFIILK